MKTSRFTFTYLLLGTALVTASTTALRAGEGPVDLLPEVNPSSAV